MVLAVRAAVAVHVVLGGVGDGVPADGQRLIGGGRHRYAGGRGNGQGRRRQRGIGFFRGGEGCVVWHQRLLFGGQSVVGGAGVQDQQPARVRILHRTDGRDARFRVGGVIRVRPYHVQRHITERAGNVGFVIAVDPLIEDLQRIRSGSKTCRDGHVHCARRGRGLRKAPVIQHIAVGVRQNGRDPVGGGDFGPGVAERHRVAGPSLRVLCGNGEPAGGIHDRQFPFVARIPGDRRKRALARFAVLRGGNEQHAAEIHVQRGPDAAHFILQGIRVIANGSVTVDESDHVRGGCVPEPPFAVRLVQQILRISAGTCHAEQI